MDASTAPTSAVDKPPSSAASNPAIVVPPGLETSAGERINNLEIPGRRARGQGLEHGEIVLVDEDGAAHRIHEGSDGCDLCVGGARGR